ncbi:hypothetical protein ANG_1402 [Streptococcus anginosus subsp. whileyi MAS624]|uniref:hypothetical protein n=1 Tax=Streptococcus anginosus TaxID=1328 RepID=UPI0003549C2A|nr:hypothetical protein [Streptococcus anginosus]BAN61872.1 hypothetical protein ANG_1402 [Streptococcus anginosus subsp. whileyi MAS624]
MKILINLWLGRVEILTKLIYTYLNNPSAELQCPIDYGTVIIDNPNRLEGNYYTGRKTRGSMRFETNNPSE